MSSSKLQEIRLSANEHSDESSYDAPPRGALGMHYPQPLLGLLLALQSQHDGLPSHWNDLQFVLFPLQLLLFVDHAAAQQTHVQQRRLLLGALIALREAERASPL